MNRLIGIGVSIIMAQTIVLVAGKTFGSPDTIYILETLLFTVALPVSALLVALGLFITAKTRIKRGVHSMSQLVRISPDVRSRMFISLLKMVKSHRTWLMLSIGLYVIVLAVPFEADNRTSSIGLMKLIFGWFFVLSGETFVWFSFLLTLASWIFMRPRSAAVAATLSSLALIIALPFLSGPSITYGWGDSLRTIPQRPEVGYFLLLASAGAALIGSLRLKVITQ